MFRIVFRHRHITFRRSRINFSNEQAKDEKLFREMHALTGSLNKLTKKEEWMLWSLRWMHRGEKTLN